MKSNLVSYLEKIDKASLSKDSIFHKGRTKESYESYLWFAFHKLEGANYHLHNVQEFLSTESRRFSELLKEKDKPLIPKLERSNELLGARVVRIEEGSRRVASEYSFELSAYLQSLRSALDFISRSIFFHFRGFEGDSIGKIVRLMNKDVDSQIIAVVRSHLEWIEYIREYRDNLVHRFIVSAYSGSQIVTTNETISGNRFPVVIPVDIPEFSYETRKTKAERPGDGILSQGLIREEYSLKVQDEEGIERAEEIRLDFKPAPGYIEIDDFMSLNISKYHQFWTDFLATLTNLDFKYDEMNN